jgi:hypothetical protein
MSEPRKYWLTDGAGEFAVASGADERDRLLPLGWSVADEPDDGWVYIWREGIAEPGRVPVKAVETLWGPNGWVVGPPPGSAHPSSLESPAEPAAEAKPKPAAGGSAKKE